MNMLCSAVDIAMEEGERPRKEIFHYASTRGGESSGSGAFSTVCSLDNTGRCEWNTETRL